MKTSDGTVICHNESAPKNRQDISSPKGKRTVAGQVFLIALDGQAARCDTPVMKFFRYILWLSVPLVLLSCSSDPHPSARDTSDAADGDLLVNHGTYLGHDADYGTLVVRENRQDPDSRLIELPVIRVRTRSQESRPPVFILGGGPGATNVFSEAILEQAGLSDRVLLWYLESHDVVYVGYRGVDGPVTLAAPQFRIALSRVSRPLSERGMETLGNALNKDIRQSEANGIDIAGYNVIEVADDIEAVRTKLAYDAIDLLSVSYGGQVAYTYCLRYAERVHRNVMVCMDAPDHLAVWDCETLDSQLEHYADLWSRDPNRVARCEDLVGTVRTVLDTIEHRGWPDADKVKIMTTAMLYSTSGAANIFDAYIDAYNGDYQKLSLLSTAFDRGMHRSAVWGDLFLKLYSMGDFDPTGDYGEGFNAADCVIGSPLAGLFFGPARYVDPPIPVIPNRYREGQTCDVQTLFVSGSLDFSGPVENVRRYLLPYFRNGHLVVLSEFGHADVPGVLQPEAFRHLVMTYLDEGIVDESKYEHAPVDFEPSPSFETWLRGQ
jgi:pimeloyl-ACP methyl ester carboxylesterase